MNKILGFFLICSFAACTSNNDKQSNGNIDKAFDTEEVTSEDNIDHAINSGEHDEATETPENTTDKNRTDTTSKQLGVGEEHSVEEGHTEKE